MTWKSQPQLSRQVSKGDLMISSAIMFSGNNFAKLQLFSRFLDIPFVSESSYHRFQSFYVTPVVDEFWLHIRQECIKRSADRDIILLG